MGVNGHYSQERVTVAEAYPGKNWTRKVMAMSDEQVHEIFVSIMFKRKNEQKQKDATQKRGQNVD